MQTNVPRTYARVFDSPIIFLFKSSLKNHDCNVKQRITQSNPFGFATKRICVTDTTLQKIIVIFEHD